MKEYLTKEEMTEYFNISDRTLDNWCKDGLPKIKVGGRIFFSAESVRLFLNERESRVEYLSA